MIDLRPYQRTLISETREALWHTRLGNIDDCWHLFRLDLLET